MEAIRKVSTKDMPKSDWLKQRQEGIGCSDVSSVLGLNNYKSSLELFYEKVEGSSEVIMNPALFMGNFLEDKVAEMYQYWDKDMETMMKNYASGTKINTIQRVNAILTNPKYPFLLGNLDRKQISPIPAAVEIKTASGYALDSWTHGIPPMYLAQCQSYMMITGYNVSKLCILKDGRYLEVYTIEANETFFNHIAERCSEFWERVTSARKLKEQGRPFESLEPDPDGTDAYEQFLRAKFKSTPRSVDGNLHQLNTAKQYIEIQDKIKALEVDQQKLKNTLMNDMREVEKISFGVAGYISFKPTVKGTRVFKVSLRSETHWLNEKKEAV